MIFTAICGSIFSLLADMPRDYYPNSLEGKNGAELKTELHNLLKNHTRLPYGSYDYNRIACTWTVFKKSDVRPNGKVWDMYSNNSYSFSSGATKGMNSRAQRTQKLVGRCRQLQRNQRSHPI